MTARLMTRNIRSRQTFRRDGRFMLTHAHAEAGQVWYRLIGDRTYRFTQLEN